MYNATLVNGNSYTLNNVRYQNGETVEVNEDTKKRLEKKAVDTVLIPGSGKVVSVQKFEFSPVGAKSTPVTPAPAPAAPVVPVDDEADDSAPAPVMASGRPKAR